MIHVAGQQATRAGFVQKRCFNTTRVFRDVYTLKMITLLEGCHGFCVACLKHFTAV